MRPHIRAVTHRLGPGAAWFVCLPVRLRNYTGVLSLLTGRKVTRTGPGPNGNRTRFRPSFWSPILVDRAAFRLLQQQRGKRPDNPLNPLR